VGMILYGSEYVSVVTARETGCVQPAKAPKKGDGSDGEPGVVPDYER